MKNWLKELNKNPTLAASPHAAGAPWSAAQRLAALHESHALKDEARHAWCRQKGLFEHQLRQWHHEFCDIDKPLATPTDAALRQARQNNEQLQRELRRKDKALAEVAALLALQKKFQALWEVEEK